MIVFEENSIFKKCTIRTGKCVEIGDPVYAMANSHLANLEVKQVLLK